MRELALRDSRSPEVQWLAGAVQDPAQLDTYLRQVWRVVPDPADAEFIRTPQLQIKQAIEHGYFVGDCDDSATLAASVCAALGYTSSLIAIRLYGDEEFSHVFLRCGNVDIDPIVPADRLPLSGYAEAFEVAIA